MFQPFNAVVFAFGARVKGGVFSQARWMAIVVALALSGSVLVSPVVQGSDETGFVPAGPDPLDMEISSVLAFDSESGHHKAGVVRWGSVDAFVASPASPVPERAVYDSGTWPWRAPVALTEPRIQQANVRLSFESEPPQAGDPSPKAQAKGVLETAKGPVLVSANVLITRSWGTDTGSDIEASYSWRSTYQLTPAFVLGLELCGSINTVATAGSASDEQEQIGPVISGRIGHHPRHHLHYDIGYFLGAGGSSPASAFQVELEYEAHF